REVGRLELAIHHHRFGEIAGQVSDRCLYALPIAVIDTAAATCIIHPGTAAFAVARIQIEIELADQRAFFFDTEELDVLVPDRRVIRFDGDREQGFDGAEQARDYFVFREILFYFLFRSEERRVGKECRSRWTL